MRQNAKSMVFILTAALTFASLLTAQTAWAQDPATIGSISYNGTLGAYEIANENNLKDLAVYVNGAGNYTTGGDAETVAHNCEGLSFKVTGNIALTHTTEWNDSGSTEDAYTPIGTSSALFKGTFDGQGYTISGLRIYKTTSPAYLNLGLFGYMGEGGTVKNINLTDVRISGGYRLGGIVGTNVLGTVSGCHIANAFIDGKDSLGGIVGQNNGTVSDCHAAETVTINANANYATSFGGIVGYLAGNSATIPASIIGCTSSVTLTIGAGVIGCKYFGGIVGRSIWYSKSGTSLNARVENCIAIGATVPEVKYSESFYHGAVVGFPKGTTFINDYYLNCTIAGTPNATGVGYISQEEGNSGINSIQSLHSIALQAGFTASGGVAVGSDTYYAANSTVTLAGSTGYTVTIDGTDPVQVVTVNESAGVYTFTMPAGNVTVSGPPDYAGLWNADAEHDGSSEAKAYIITTTAGLNLLAGEVNTGNNQEGKFFKLGNDIIYSHTTDWDDATSTENNYIPIGYSNVFSGTFDGCGYTVSGIRIYKGGSSNVDSYLGLFGQTSSGTVKNVTLSDARITGYEFIGGIVGSNRFGTVSNCTVTGNVCIHSVVSSAGVHGGIVGYNLSSLGSYPSATVTGCTSSAQLTVADGITNVHNSGGIAGWNAQSSSSHPSTISNCLVIGATVMKSNNNSNYVGAIAGDNTGTYTGGNDPGTLSHNYYSNSTVGHASWSANTDVGLGNSGGPGDEAANDGARGIGRIFLGEKVSKSGGTTVTVGSTEYYYAGEEITLGHGEAPLNYTFSGYMAKDAADNDVTDAVISVSTLTMPATDLTVTARWIPIALSLNAAKVLGEDKYVTTFYHSTLDYQLPEGAVAYTASLVDGNVVFYRIGEASDIVPHGTAVIVVADAASVSITKLDANPGVTPHAGNILQGTDTEIAKPTGTVYVLGKDANDVMTFLTFNGSTIPAGKAYYLVTE